MIMLYVCEIVCVCMFGFVYEVEMLCEIGLVCGGSMDNVIVFDEYWILNNDGLCYDDEFVKYKMFDVIGDLYVIGYLLLVLYIVYKLGYGLNNVLLCELFVYEDVYEIVMFDDL